jgi:hypothetical protein
MPDSYAAFSTGLTTPIVKGFAIVPNDAADLPEVTRQIRVTGSGGAIAVVWPGGEQTIEPVSAGEPLDWRIVRVLATGTTATGLRGYV